MKIDREGRPWLRGDNIPLTEDPKGRYYIIWDFIGERKKGSNIHIRKNEAGKEDLDGRYDVYWHSGKYLIHHGGEPGFSTIKDVKRQHERVLLGYTGMVIQLPLDSGEVPAEEQTEGIPTSGIVLPETIRNLRSLEIPGEQQRLNRWIKILQDSNRDLPQVRVSGQLADIRKNLDKVRKALWASLDPHKKSAGQKIEEGLAGSKGDLLLAANEAQTELLKRTQQTVSIVVGTMRRYDDLERKQIYWNGIVDSLPGIAGGVLKVLLMPSFIDAQRLERSVSNNILNEKIGIIGKLGELKGQPYYERAKAFLLAFSPLKELAEAGKYEPMIPLLEKQAGELQIWANRNREDNPVSDFGKYNLKPKA